MATNGTYGSMEDGKRSSFRIGIYISPKKIQKMNFETFMDYASRHQDVTLIMIDINTPLEQQGPFDLVLHKLTSEIIDSKFKSRLDSIENYFNLHPQVIQIDPIISQRRTLDRETMNLIFKKVQEELPKEHNIRNPQFRSYGKEESTYDVHGLKFPLVCKTTVAGGVSHAHKMGIVFNEKALHDFKPPIVVQEFFNHNATIFKVFVLGDFFYTVKRDSLPNIHQQDSKTIFFDSQLPLDSQLGDLNSNGNQSNNSSAIEPSHEVLNAIRLSLSDHFGLSLFGFDVIVHEESQSCAIIDINYFPGYIGVEDFDRKLLEMLLSRIR